MRAQWYWFHSYTPVDTLMTKLLKTTVFFLTILSLTSCTRSCQRFKRKNQIGEKDCTVRQFSGGQLIRQWNFKGIVNSDEHSDGYYFTIGDTLYEVSGDVQVLIKE